MEEKEFNRRKPKKVKVPRQYSIAILGQVIMSIFVIVFYLFYITEKKFLSLFQLSFAICMFFMAYNNQKYFKRPKVNVLYIACGIIMLVLGIWNLIGDINGKNILS